MTTATTPALTWASPTPALKPWEAALKRWLQARNYTASAIADALGHASDEGDLFKCESVDPEHREDASYALWESLAFDC